MLGVLILLAALLFLALVPGPRWIVGHPKVTATDLLRARDDTRATLVQVLGGIAILGGLFFTAQTYRASINAQITDRFAKAVGLLGESGLHVRIGALYALDRIGRDSRRDYMTVIDQVRRFVLERASSDLAGAPQRSLPEDIQVALELLGRRPRHAVETRRLDLSDAILPGANLYAAHLDAANFAGAELRGADFVRATLRNAWLGDARIEEARFTNADLRGAGFNGSDLTGAMFRGADMRGVGLYSANASGACFSGSGRKGTGRRNFGPAAMAGADVREAIFADADLCGVDLSRVRGLTRDQVDSARIDEKTVLPPLSDNEAHQSPDDAVDEEPKEGDEPRNSA